MAAKTPPPPEPPAAPEPPAPPPPPPAAPRLYRAKNDRILGGVAGGIAQHLGIDPVIVRLAFVVLVLAGGSGVLAYVIAWIVVPEEPTPGAALAAARVGASPPVVAGIALIGLGIVLLLQRLLPPDWWRFAAPLGLVALGVALLVRREGRS